MALRLLRDIVSNAWGENFTRLKSSEGRKGIHGNVWVVFTLNLYFHPSHHNPKYLGTDKHRPSLDLSMLGSPLVGSLSLGDLTHPGPLDQGGEQTPRCLTSNAPTSSLPCIASHQNVLQNMTIAFPSFNFRLIRRRNQFISQPCTERWC